MKKKISFTTWVTVLTAGIVQFFGTIFSTRNKTPFWRILWSVIGLCVLAVTAMLAYSFYHECYLREQRYKYTGDRLGGEIYYHNQGYNKGKSYIFDSQSKKKLLTGIDWIAKSMDGDSLAVVSKDGKRGYVNRYTGQMAIPLTYDAAWVFSDGVAAVCLGDSVFFIDHSGTPVNGIRYPREHNFDGYAYHGGHTAIRIDGRYGLADLDGRWSLAPEYENIMAAPRNMWLARRNGRWGIIASNGTPVTPCTYIDISLMSDDGIIVTLEDHSKKRLDYDGSVIDDFVTDGVHRMDYITDNHNTEGESLLASAGLYKYESAGRYGLMTRDGHPLTPPAYTEIDAISADLYQCRILQGDGCVILDKNGRKVNIK